MKRRFLLIVASAIVSVAMAAGNADAQTSGKWTGHGYAHVDAGVQVDTPGFTSNVTFKLYGEDGTLTGTYRFVSSGIVAARGGIRLFGNFGLGVGISRFERAGEADITAGLPHPFHFNQFRRVSGTARDLNRREVMTSAELSWMLRPSRKIDVMLFAGPAYFSTNQDMVTAPRYTETYPYDTATFVGVESKAVRKTGVGFTTGLDVSCLVTGHFGLGGLVRFSRANASFSAAPGSSTSVRLGGVQASGGLRIRF